MALGSHGGRVHAGACPADSQQCQRANSELACRPWPGRHHPFRTSGGWSRPYTAAAPTAASAAVPPSASSDMPAMEAELIGGVDHPPRPGARREGRRGGSLVKSFPMGEGWCRAPVWWRLPCAPPSRHLGPAQKPGMRLGLTAIAFNAASTLVDPSGRRASITVQSAKPASGRSLMTRTTLQGTPRASHTSPTPLDSISKATTPSSTSPASRTGSVMNSSSGVRPCPIVGELQLGRSVGPAAGHVHHRVGDDDTADDGVRIDPPGDPAHHHLIDLEGIR